MPLSVEEVKRHFNTDFKLTMFELATYISQFHNLTQNSALSKHWNTALRVCTHKARSQLTKFFKFLAKDRPGFSLW